MSIYIDKQVINNWLRIVNYDINVVLYDTYLSNLELLSENKKCWLCNVREIVDNTLGFTKLWLKPGTAKNGCKIKHVVNNLKYLYESQWLNYINRNDDHNKLGTYNKLKRDFGMEIYLQGIPDYRIRKNFD